MGHLERWLWAVVAIYAASFLIFFGLSLKPHRGEKVFHYLFLIASLISGLYYLELALYFSNPLPDGTEGAVGIMGVFHPLTEFLVLIIALGLISSVKWATIVFHIALVLTWAVACSAMHANEHYGWWGFYIFAIATYILFIFSTHTSSRATLARGLTLQYNIFAGSLNFVLLLATVATGLSYAGSDSKRVVNPRTALFFDSIMELFLLLVLPFVILFLSKSWDYDAMGLHYTQYGRVSREGTAKA